MCFSYSVTLHTNANVSDLGFVSFSRVLWKTKGSLLSDANTSSNGDPQTTPRKTPPRTFPLASILLSFLVGNRETYIQQRLSIPRELLASTQSTCFNLLLQEGCVCDDQA